jgi:ribosomal protein L11
MTSVQHKINVFIRSQQAEPGPPLGTVLGNLGLNATKFCKEFNEFTEELPAYFYLQVEISILDDKSFAIKAALPSIGFILSLLKQERILKRGPKETIEYFVHSSDIVELAMLKLPQEPLERAVPIICGTALAADLKVG